MYRRILVPVDGSPTSDLGLREAVELARQTGATLRIVHAVNESIFDSTYVMPQTLSPQTYQSLCEALRADGTRVLEAAQALARDAGVEHSAQLLETSGGRAAQFILDAVRQWPADLIVMGTHGRRGVSRLVLGSDAELVLRSSPVPVLLVRGPAAAA